jgi:hypothetical protein
VFQGFFDDLSGMDSRAVDGAAEEVFAGDESTVVINGSR